MKKGLFHLRRRKSDSIFSDKGYSEEAANKAYDYYSAGNWKDSKGKRVKNWKQKMIAVWFKAENLKTIENGNKEGRIDF